jgi:hypothetical protein
VDDASSLEGTRWAVGTAASASAVLSYLVLTQATAVTNITARRLAAERPARPPAKPAGVPSPRTNIGARVEVPALRYKMSQWRNPLVLVSKQPLRRARDLEQSFPLMAFLSARRSPRWLA